MWLSVPTASLESTRGASSCDCRRSCEIFTKTSIAAATDEAANFLARAIVLLLFGAIVATAWWKRMPLVKAAALTIGAFLLLTPALHPWYALWAVPLVAEGGASMWIVLATLVPLGYQPLINHLDGQPWRETPWPRGIEHGLTWMVLLWQMVEQRGWRRWADRGPERTCKPTDH